MKNQTKNNTFVKKMVLEQEEMNEWQRTDLIANVIDCPFITLTESKMINIWYHEEIDSLFCLTSQGFMFIKGGSKDLLFKNGLGRN